MLSLLSYCENELIIKKSRFLAEAFPITKADEARQILKEQREKHKGARHVVHAFIVGSNGEIQGSSDDGEPKGTAGHPSLAVLQYQKATNIMLTTTRWFGGILLGTGGLVRAYTESAKELLALATLQEIKRKICFSIKCTYPQSNQLRYLLETKDIAILSAEYGESVIFSVSVLEENEKHLISSIEENIRGVLIKKLDVIK